MTDVEDALAINQQADYEQLGQSSFITDELSDDYERLKEKSKQGHYDVEALQNLLGNLELADREQDRPTLS